MLICIIGFRWFQLAHFTFKIKFSKNGNLDFIQIKITLKEIKVKTDWKKVCTVYVSGKGLVGMLY